MATIVSSTMGQMKNWEFSLQRWQGVLYVELWDHNFLPHHMNLIFVEAWYDFNVSYVNIVRESFSEQIYFPSVLLTSPPTPRHLFLWSKYLLEPRPKTYIKYHTTLLDLSRYKKSVPLIWWLSSKQKVFNNNLGILLSVMLHTTLWGNEPQSPFNKWINNRWKYWGKKVILKNYDKDITTMKKPNLNPYIYLATAKLV